VKKLTMGRGQTASSFSRAAYFQPRATGTRQEPKTLCSQENKPNDEPDRVKIDYLGIYWAELGTGGVDHPGSPCGR
jgi:hypothetical protein